MTAHRRNRRDRPRVHAAAALVLSVLFVGGGLGVGCGGPPRVHTTFLRAVDLVEMTDRMAESFARDPVIGRRSEGDAPWVISIDRIVNHTNEIIPDGEKWLYVARLRGRLARTEFSNERSLIWVIPPERWPMVAEELDVPDEPYGLRLDPTHLLSAEFYSITNTSGRGRTDAYLCSFQLVDLDSGVLTWEDRWEVKRAASGLTYD